WDAGAQKPHSIALPPGFAPAGLHARARDDVWIAGEAGRDRPAVVHFDGHSVELTRLPGDGHPVSVTSEPDGTLWAAGALDENESSVWRCTPHGVWSEVPLPEPAIAWTIVARGIGDVWVSASSARGKLVFRSQEPRVIFQAPARELRWDALYRLGRKDLP